MRKFFFSALPGVININLAGVEMLKFLFLFLCLNSIDLFYRLECKTRGLQEWTGLVVFRALLTQCLEIKDGL